MNKREIGTLGEDIPCENLLKNKYEILNRNFYTKFGEIDIVARKKDELVFIEVKAKSNNNYGYPSESVNALKRKRIISSAKYYLLKNNISNLQCRFDIIEVYLNKNIINHIENAF